MTPADILAGLTMIANEWRFIAVAWHVFFGVLLFALAAGWRPPKRDLSLLLVAPVVSVSAVAWTSTYPFNGITFAPLALLLAVVAARHHTHHVHISPPSRLVPGLLLIAFGWVYPHFVAVDSWLSYLYAAPLGVLPCPTLSMVLGVTLVASLGSRWWGVLLSTAGAVYGAFGVLVLQVEIDVVLFFGAVAAGIVVGRTTTREPRSTVRLAA